MPISNLLHDNEMAVQYIIGVSLSEPHTSVTAFAEVVCISVCGHIP